jgi:hypothetical protein
MRAPMICGGISSDVTIAGPRWTAWRIVTSSPLPSGSTGKRKGFPQRG